MDLFLVGLSLNRTLDSILMDVCSRLGDSGALAAVDQDIDTEFGLVRVPVVGVSNGQKLLPYIHTGDWGVGDVQECLKWLALVRASTLSEAVVQLICRVEPPAVLKVLALDSSESRFQLQCLLQCSPREFNDNAAVLNELAGRYYGERLAGVENVFSRLDQFVDEHLYGRPVLKTTAHLVGSFVGEALIGEFGGGWTRVDDWGAPKYVVQLGKGNRVEVDPLARAGRRLIEGNAHAFSLFHQAVQEVVKGQSVS